MANLRNKVYLPCHRTTLQPREVMHECSEASSVTSDQQVCRCSSAPVTSPLPGRRAEKQQLQAQVQILQGRAERSERALEPLRARVRDLTAQVESHAEEVKSVRHTKPCGTNPCAES